MKRPPQPPTPNAPSPLDSLHRPTEAGVIRVLVADDHAIVRRGLAQILAEAPDITLAGEAACAAELHRRLAQTPLDVLLLDISLPDRNGFDVLTELRPRFPQLRIIVLSAHGEEQFAQRAWQCGACAYLPKEAAPEELLHAIRHVHQHGNYIRPSQSQNALRHLLHPKGKPPALSPREFDTLRRLAAGQSLSQIATALRLSVKTVSTYRSRLLQKLGLDSNAALTRYALEKRLIE